MLNFKESTRSYPEDFSECRFYGFRYSPANWESFNITRADIGVLFGTSNEVNMEIAKIIPVFLISVPFVSVNRITTASFYATEKIMLSYISTFAEPIFMIILMLILPPLFGGQIMIWWSVVFARIL